MTSKRKIFDITPPQNRMSDSGQAVQGKSEKKTKEEKIEERKKPIFGKKLIPIFAAAAVLAALASSYFLIPPKARIELWPQKKNIEEKAAVLVSPTKKGENFIPGEILEIEKVVSRDFAVQGKKLKTTKAQGTIRVYNNYSASSQILVAGTRFLSDGGKLFRSQAKVMVPGGQYEGVKLTAGFIDIKVAADQPGEDYNIGVSTFSIPGFAGTPKYTTFYAKSFEPMEGGAKEQVSYITQKDLDDAEDVITQIALQESGVTMKNAISAGKFILADIDKAISTKVADFKATAELGQETENFSAQIKTAVKAIVFKEETLSNFSKSYIQSKLLPEEKLIDSFLKIKYSPQSADLGKGELTLNLAISAKSHSTPEESVIKEMVSGRSSGELGDILKGLPQIEKSKIEFWPFWVSSAPKSLNNIKVILHID